MSKNEYKKQIMKRKMYWYYVSDGARPEIKVTNIPLKKEMGIVARSFVVEKVHLNT